MGVKLSRTFRTVFQGGAQAALRDLHEGAAFTLFCQGNAGLGELIAEALERVGPCQLTLSLFSLSMEGAKTLESLLASGKLTELALLVDRSFSGRHPHYAARVTEMFGRDRIRTPRIKARFGILQGGTYPVVIRGSGGLNRSVGYDLYDVDADESLARWLLGEVAVIAGGLPPGWATNHEVKGEMRQNRASSKSNDFGFGFGSKKDFGF